jgi:putative PIN family toxin of toxin-antitoxin system
MKNKVSRIVLDTNLWISFLIRQDFAKLDTLIFSNQCILIFSEELLQEFLTVAKRPKFRRFFSQNDIEELIETIEEYAEFINVNTEVTVCRDPKDNFLLSLSQEGQVDYLLTGDKDLLALKTFGSTIILTISDFLK